MLARQRKQHAAKKRKQRFQESEVKDYAVDKLLEKSSGLLINSSQEIEREFETRASESFQDIPSH